MRELYYLVIVRPKDNYEAPGEIALQTKVLDEANAKCREINSGQTQMAKIETWTKVR